MQDSKDDSFSVVCSGSSKQQHPAMNHRNPDTQNGENLRGFGRGCIYSDESSPVADRYPSRQQQQRGAAERPRSGPQQQRGAADRHPPRQQQQQRGPADRYPPGQQQQRGAADRYPPEQQQHDEAAERPRSGQQQHSEELASVAQLAHEFVSKLAGLQLSVAIAAVLIINCTCPGVMDACVRCSRVSTQSV